MKKHDEVIDIELTPTRKKRFRIDGDNDRILEIDIADMGIITRLNRIYPKVIELAEKLGKDTDLVQSDDAEENIKQTGEYIEKLDTEMRKLIDELFDANVSETCAPSGTMWDLFDGQFRFEHIIDKLTPLYENNLSKEIENTSKRISKHTQKYTK